MTSNKNIKIIIFIIIFGVFVYPANAATYIVNKDCLSPSLKIDKSEMNDSFTNLEADDKGLDYDFLIGNDIENYGYGQVEQFIRNLAYLPSPKMKITITASNGRFVDLILPATGSINSLLEEKIFKEYVAKFYAHGVALGNPGENIYIEVVDMQQNSLKETQSKLIEIIQTYYDNAGMPLLSKANAGNRITVQEKANNFQAKPEFGQLDIPIKLLNGEELAAQGRKLNVIGIDVGGQGMSANVLVNGEDVTDILFPKSENEDLLKQEDRSMRYRYSYGYDHIKNGGTAAEFKERVKIFVKQLVDSVESRYGKVEGVFVTMPGAPDFENNRMGSVGELSRGFAQGAMEKELAEFNRFIPELQAELGYDVAFGFGNDMTGWALAIANEAGIKDGVMIITGSGIGVKQVENGKDVSGVNEGGHLRWNVNEDIDSFSQDSPLGSFEDWAGSVRGILNIATNNGLIKMIIDRYASLGANINEIEPKHIGFLAAGINPYTNELLSAQEQTLKELALDVWDKIEQREAQLVIQLYKLTGKTQFAFSGGTTVGQTGEIRKTFLNKYINELRQLLGINDQIKVALVQANAAWGSSLKAEQYFQEQLAAKAQVQGVIYTVGNTILDFEGEMTLSQDENLDKELLFVESAI
jgi:hypothetical protein